MTMRRVEITTWLIMKSTSAAASAAARPLPSRRRARKCTRWRTWAVHCSTMAKASVRITGWTVPALWRKRLQLVTKRARKAVRLSSAMPVAVGIQISSMLKCDWSAWRMTSSNSMSFGSMLALLRPQPERAKYQKWGRTDCASSPPTQGLQSPCRPTSTMRCVWRASMERRQGDCVSTRSQSSSRKTSKSTRTDMASFGRGCRSRIRRS
mmetsp:Transcript_74765/g.219014  ORF Transcript_74765/g.219014 Transcript_74765/m.219014 type:complete len:209 (-) Transcript_74765:215-841(-)